MSYGLFRHFICRLIFLCVIFCISSQSYGQPFVYNLGVTQGLPSNRVYHMLTDRYGYLWMATPEGVARYNGYEVRVFDVSDDLPNNDVWELFEDKKGRIWLLSFAQSIGYIENDEYHEAFISDPSIKILPVPHSIGSYGAGIFLDNSHTDSASQGVMLIEYRDTLYPYFYSLDYLRWSRNIPAGGIASHDSAVWGKSRMYIYHSWRREGLSRPSRHKLKVNSSRYSWIWMYNNFLLGYDPTAQLVDVYDERMRRNREIKFDKPVTRVKLLAGTNEYLYLLADSILFQYSQSLDSLISVQNLASLGAWDMFSSVIHSDLWEQVVGVSGNGVYLMKQRPVDFELVDANMTEYRSVGTDSRGDGYWWNDWSRQLIRYKGEGDEKQVVRIESKHHIKVVAPWSSDHSLLLINMYGPMLINHSANGTIIPFPEDKLQWLRSVEDINFNQLWRVNDFAMIDTSEMYLISRPYGFVQLDLANQQVKTIAHPTGSASYGVVYTGMVHDPVSNSVIAYGSTEMIIYRRGASDLAEQILKMSNTLLSGVEKVWIDAHYGNLFYKKGESLFMINRLTGIVQSIEGNLNVRKAHTVLYQDKLIVAGRFGVAIYKILGSGKISTPIIYRQIRNEFYSTVNSLIVAGDHIYLNTDLGLIKCRLPDEGSFSDKTWTPPSKAIEGHLLVRDMRGLRQVRSGDTVVLAPGSGNLQFDFVNPLGNGNLRFTYYLMEWDKRRVKQGKNDVSFTDLKPDRYYNIKMQISDDVTKDYVSLKLYTQPYWWQEWWIQRMIIGAIVVAILLLGWLVVWITRRVMINKNNQKNMQMEIELKSIYAQINPHFINNTLNSILAMIKSGNTSDAFYNVSRFSRLLRAYIKSSRNRFISIGDEIDNLRNYVELQQARFKDKFRFEIEIDDPDGSLKTTMIPSLLLQPLVENAINHGLFHKSGHSGLLKIIFRKGLSDREIMCIIEDNGVGRKSSERIKKQNTIRTDESYGDILIRDLIAILNRYEQINIQIEYEDKILPETGTIVTLSIVLPWKKG